MWVVLCLLISTTCLPSFSSSTPLQHPYLIQNHLSYTSTPKLSLADSAEWTEYHVREPEGPGTYSFGYDVDDSLTGNVQFRTEERRPNGTVTGSYGYVSPEGNVHVVHYVADHLGYRTKIEEAKKLKSSNDHYKFMENSQESISPQMLAALQSLSNSNRFQKEDQHLRPIDRINSNSPNVDNILEIPKKDNIEEKRNNFYKSYFVPPNYRHN